MILLKNKDTGLTRECPTGFSWTVFFFGLFVPLIRGDLKWSAIFFALTLLVGLPTLGLGAPIVGIVFSFFYNKVYIRELMSKGFIPADDHSHNWCIVNSLLTGHLISTQAPQTAPVPQPMSAPQPATQIEKQPLPAIDASPSASDEASPKPDSLESTEN